MNNTRELINFTIPEYYFDKNGELQEKKPDNSYGLANYHIPMYVINNYSHKLNQYLSEIDKSVNEEIRKE